jgi:hypothetical protein
VPGYGTLGLAPEGTILAEGTGTADVKVDGSDRAAALKQATDSALADARSQAQVVATSMGVTLKDIYSLSVTSSDNYAYATPDCLVPPIAPEPGQSNVAGAVSTTQAGSPGICVAPANPATPSSAQEVVTLLVAYRFG